MSAGNEEMVLIHVGPNEMRTHVDNVKDKSKNAKSILSGMIRRRNTSFRHE